MLALESLASILLRAEQAAKKGSTVDAPRDSDVIAAAKEILDRGYFRAAPERPPHSLVGSYDLDKLTNDQPHALKRQGGLTQAQILAPPRQPSESAHQPLRLRCLAAPV
jgi:hypothetical protein